MTLLFVKVSTQLQCAASRHGFTKFTDSGSSSQLGSIFFFFIEKKTPNLKDQVKKFLQIRITERGLIT